MAEQSICSNCGNPLKNHRLVCNHCQQARWKRIVPYYIWGVVFLVGTWWLYKNKLTEALYATDFLSLLIIIATVLLAILGVVMLLIALIATLKGLFVKKVSAEQRATTISQLSTSASAPLSRAETSGLSYPSAEASDPGIAPLAQPETLELERPSEQAIFCQKCKHENAPDATRCGQCGIDLLPGEGVAERTGALIGTFLLTGLGIGGAYLFFKYNPEWGLKSMLFLVGLIVFGVIAFVYGIFLSLRKIPIHERYEKRAKRHVSVNAWQAIADYGSAIKTAPSDNAAEDMLERAKLYQGLGKTAEARSDWQHVLENINARLSMPKASIDLLKLRAEIYKNLGMQDEYALQMLQYTLEKEKTFKTKRSDVAMGWEEGIKKGSEDFKRQELDKIRAEILSNPRFKIIAECKQCHSEVDLNASLYCPNNFKHRKLIKIRPALRENA